MAAVLAVGAAAAHAGVVPIAAASSAAAVAGYKLRKIYKRLKAKAKNTVGVATLHEKIELSIEGTVFKHENRLYTTRSGKLYQLDYVGGKVVDGKFQDDYTLREVILAPPVLHQGEATVPGSGDVVSVAPGAIERSVVVWYDYNGTDAPTFVSFGLLYGSSVVTQVHELFKSKEGAAWVDGPCQAETGVLPLHITTANSWQEYKADPTGYNVKKLGVRPIARAYGHDLENYDVATDSDVMVIKLDQDTVSKLTSAERKGKPLKYKEIRSCGNSTCFTYALDGEQRIVKARGNCTRIPDDSGLMWHTAPTTAGSSGCPIFVTANGQHKLRGIHLAAQFINGKPVSNVAANTAIIITRLAAVNEIGIFASTLDHAYGKAIRSVGESARDPDEDKDYWDRYHRKQAKAFYNDVAENDIDERENGMDEGGGIMPDPFEKHDRDQRKWAKRGVHATFVDREMRPPSLRPSWARGEAGSSSSKETAEASVRTATMLEALLEAAQLAATTDAEAPPGEEPSKEDTVEALTVFRKAGLVLNGLDTTGDITNEVLVLSEALRKKNRERKGRAERRRRAEKRMATATGPAPGLEDERTVTTVPQAATQPARVPMEPTNVLPVRSYAGFGASAFNPRPKHSAAVCMMPSVSPNYYFKAVGFDRAYDGDGDAQVALDDRWLITNLVSPVTHGYTPVAPERPYAALTEPEQIAKARAGLLALSTTHDIDDIGLLFTGVTSEVFRDNCCKNLHWYLSHYTYDRDVPWKVAPDAHGNNGFELSAKVPEMMGARISRNKPDEQFIAAVAEVMGAEVADQIKEYRFPSGAKHEMEQSMWADSATRSDTYGRWEAEPAMLDLLSTIEVAQPEKRSNVLDRFNAFVATLDLSKSTGWSAPAFGQNKRMALEGHSDAVYHVVLERIVLLYLTDLEEWTTSACWADDLKPELRDPYCCFLKGEPHNATKVAAGRWRKIWTSSLVDLCVDGLLSKWYSRSMIRQYQDNPAGSQRSIGIGHHDQGHTKIAGTFESCIDAGFDVFTSVDASGWDMSVSERAMTIATNAKFSARAASIVEEHNGERTGVLNSRLHTWQRLYVNRMLVMTRGLWSICGDIYTNSVAGLLASGMLETSSANTDMRIGLFYAAVRTIEYKKYQQHAAVVKMVPFATGDDLVFCSWSRDHYIEPSEVLRAMETYCAVKSKNPMTSETVVEYTSHEYTRVSPGHWAVRYLNAAKTMARMAVKATITEEGLICVPQDVADGVQYAMRYSEHYRAYLRLLRDVGMVPKDLRELNGVDDYIC